MIALLLCTFCADPIIVAEVKPPTALYQVMLTVPELDKLPPEKVFAIWRFEGDTSKIVNAKEGDTSLYFECPKGKWRVRCVYKVDGQKKKELVYVVDADSAPTPNPGPTPDPGPNPQPGPTSPVAISELFVIIITETGQADATRGSFIFNRELNDRFSKVKGKRFVDQNGVDATGTTPADLKPYIDYVKTASVPMFFVVDSKGGVRLKGKLTTPQELVKAIDDVVAGKVVADRMLWTPSTGWLHESEFHGTGMVVPPLRGFKHSQGMIVGL